MSKILFIDGQNFMHRARSGFQLGDYNIVYNFFRSLKPLIDKFEPTRVYFTQEGHPKRRYELLPEYKANRIPDQTTPEGVAKYKSDADFHRQAKLIIGLLTTNFPVSVMRHPDFEADDVIYNVINNASRAIEFTVVSTDTDFIQLLNEFPNVRLYNPVTKLFVEKPDYNYVSWKALRGDGSDNIPGIPGVGDKTAEQVLGDPDLMRELFREHGETYTRNVELIRLARWTEEETGQMHSAAGTKDWAAVEEVWKDYAFQSMCKEPYWTKFKATFDTLWG